MGPRCSLAIVSSFLWIASLGGASAGELAWQPRWTEGRYWIVRSPMMQKRVDPMGEEIGAYKIGDYYTKFKVTSVVESRAGRRAKLEIRWNENNEYAFQDNPEYVELEIDLLNLTVLRKVERGFDARGQPFEVPWTAPREARGKVPFCWWWEGALPGASPSLPLVERSTSTPGAYVMKSAVGTPTWPFEQEVTMDGDAAVVTVHIDSCTSERMRFRADAPWYDVVDASGKVIREVVEVGQEWMCP